MRRLIGVFFLFQVTAGGAAATAALQTKLWAAPLASPLALRLAAAVVGHRAAQRCTTAAPAAKMLTSR